jgi:hypothetical protein
MEYIFNKIIPITLGYEKINKYFKTKLVGGIFGCIVFVKNDIDIYYFNLRPFRSFKFLVENPLKNVFFALVK